MDPHDTKKQNVNQEASLTTRVLVVDDEASIQSLLNRVLVREGFDVLSAMSGQEGLVAAAKEKPDLVILDLNLPDLYGEEVCSKLRQDPSTENVPVLILTGKNATGLSAHCLNGGADDYLSKPFDITDILAHMRALLRRSQGRVSSRGVISSGRLTIRIAERMVFWRGHRIATLAPKEFDILRHLVLEAPKVIDKNSLALKTWGISSDQLHQRTLDVHIRRIRKKLGTAAAACLKTVPAIGFQWLDESSSPVIISTASR
jgi:DNA-binding response OmpR family regulator